MKTQIEVINEYNDAVMSSISEISKKLSGLISKYGFRVKVDSLSYVNCILILVDSETNEPVYGTDIDVSLHTPLYSEDMETRIDVKSQSFTPGEEPAIGLMHLLIYYLSINHDGILDLISSKMKTINELYENILEF